MKHSSELVMQLVKDIPREVLEVLIKCQECGREISDRAASCPGCGMPQSPANAPPPGEVNRCGHCNWRFQGSSVACPVCDGLLTNRSAGALASPGRRLGGHLIGTAVFLIPALMLHAAEELLILAVLLLVCVWSLELYAWSESTTIGKWALGMRVCFVTGAPLGFGMMLVRETFGKLISGLVFGLGILWILFDRDKQGWHDKMVGSIVVVQRHPWT